MVGVSATRATRSSRATVARSWRPTFSSVIAELDAFGLAALARRSHSSKRTWDAKWRFGREPIRELVFSMTIDT